jgi:hypothetical protein
MHVGATPSHIDQPDGRSEIRIGASKGIVMLRSHSIPIKANYYINILYYFLYLTLSSSTPRDAFPTGHHPLSRAFTLSPLKTPNQVISIYGISKMA